MNDVAQTSFDYPLAGVDSGPSAEPEPQPSNVQSEGMEDTDMNGPSTNELVDPVCQKADESMESDLLVESELKVVKTIRKLEYECLCPQHNPVSTPISAFLTLSTYCHLTTRTSLQQNGRINLGECARPSCPYRLCRESSSVSLRACSKSLY